MHTTGGKNNVKQNKANKLQRRPLIAQIFYLNEEKKD